MDTIVRVPNLSTKKPSSGPSSAPSARERENAPDSVVRLHPKLRSSATKNVPVPWKTVVDMSISMKLLMPIRYHP